MTRILRPTPWAGASLIAALYLRCYGRVPEHIREQLLRPCGRCGIELAGSLCELLCLDCESAVKT